MLPKRIVLLALLIFSELCVANYEADFDSADFQNRIRTAFGNDITQGEMDKIA